MNTLIGREGWLFLADGSAGELRSHCQGITGCTERNFDKYLPYLDKFLLVVYPDKSVICNKYLPDGYEVKYRPALQLAQATLPSKNLLDGLDHLSGLKPEQIFYKTDTHMKLQAAYLIYRAVVERLALSPKDCSFEEAQEEKGHGDLTEPQNLGDQPLEDIAETLDRPINGCLRYMLDCYDRDPGKIYQIQDGDPYSLEIHDLQGKDETALYLGTPFSWSMISSMITLFHSPQPSSPQKVLIFYDSFGLATMSLFIELFSTTIWAKRPYDPSLIERYQPDFILELRVERFLS